LPPADLRPSSNSRLHVSALVTA